MNLSTNGIDFFLGTFHNGQGVGCGWRVLIFIKKSSVADGSLDYSNIDGLGIMEINCFEKS